MLDTMKNRGERVTHLRELLGYTQDDFAELMNVSRGAVGNWELGKGISGKNLTKIAEMAGTYSDWFVNGRGEPPKAKSDLKRIVKLPKLTINEASSSFELLPVIEAAVRACLDTTEAKFSAQFRNLIVQNVVLILVNPPTDEALLPEETRAQILLEAGGPTFLERAKLELPHRKSQS